LLGFANGGTTERKSVEAMAPRAYSKWIRKKANLLLDEGDHKWLYE